MARWEYRVKVESVDPGRLADQNIVVARGGSVSVEFDSIAGLFTVEEGENLSIVVSSEKPADLDEYDFCGHGYLVTPESDSTILSLWGIIFKFKPPIGLALNTKYYLCMKREGKAG